MSVIRYHDLDDAIAQANRVEVGLSASVWSPDIEKARAVAARLEAGSVYINHHGVIHPMVPFGGVKKSGWGVQFGTEGLKAVTLPQIISLKKTPK